MQDGCFHPLDLLKKKITKLIFELQLKCWEAVVLLDRIASLLFAWLPGCPRQGAEMLRWRKSLASEAVAMKGIHHRALRQRRHFGSRRNSL